MIIQLTNIAKTQVTAYVFSLTVGIAYSLNVTWNNLTYKHWMLSHIMFSSYSLTLSILLQFYIYYFTDAWIVVTGYCQSIPSPSSSSETIITSTQGVPTSSTRSVPTHLTQTVMTNSTQRSINQKDNIAITTPNEYSFFRKFLIPFDL